ncbi:MAG: sortase [Actinomycetota bacterium]
MEARPSGETWRRPLRYLGIACLMGAAFFGGYVGWLLWGTGLQTAKAQEVFRESPTVQTWALHPKPAPDPADPGPRLVPGDAYGVIQIPSIGVDFVVVEGTGYEDLKAGPGHYTDTADPWDGTGRVGIAGHRTTYLAPFFDLDKVAVGDRISLITPFGTYRYEVTANFILPEETAGKVLAQTNDPTLVLTTCHPKYASSQRLIIEADLVGGP